MPLHAAEINSVEATYDLENEGLELFFDFADTSDTTTPSGLIKMGIDFDLMAFRIGPWEYPGSAARKKLVMLWHESVADTRPATPRRADQSS